MANRRAWCDVSKLTPEVLQLYKQPLKVQGWDLALLEVSSFLQITTAKLSQLKFTIGMLSCT